MKKIYTNPQIKIIRLEAWVMDDISLVINSSSGANQEEDGRAPARVLF